MNYVIVTQEWMSAHGLLPLPTNRKSADGTKVLLHEEMAAAVAARGADGGYDGVLGTYGHNAARELADTDPEWAPSGDGAQDGATYLCTRGTETPVYAALSELLGIYVEQVTGA